MRAWTSRLPVLFFLGIILIFSSSCGGGTYGTGGPQVTGTVKSKQGQALAGVIVTVEETGSSDTTDDQGWFDIQSGVESSEFTLSIWTDTFSDNVLISDVAGGVEKVEVHLKVDLERGEIDSVVVEQEDPVMEEEIPDAAGEEDNSGNPSDSDTPDSVSGENSQPESPPSSDSSSAPKPGPGPGEPPDEDEENGESPGPNVPSDDQPGPGAGSDTAPGPGPGDSDPGTGNEDSPGAGGSTGQSKGR
jgi:hypothetical protein